MKKIIHVGIMNGKYLHSASGKVEIDHLDHPRYNVKSTNTPGVKLIKKIVKNFFAFR
jgi:hypothetical protein